MSSQRSVEENFTHSIICIQACTANAYSEIVLKIIIQNLLMWLKPILPTENKTKICPEKTLEPKHGVNSMETIKIPQML